jgi:hypothetical protein
MLTALLLFVAAFTAQMVMAPRRPAPVVQDAPPPFDWDAEIRRIEHEEAVMFAENPLAFWLDPHRYGGKRLEEREAEQQFLITLGPDGRSYRYFVDGRQFDNMPAFSGFPEMAR